MSGLENVVNVAPAMASGAAMGLALRRQREQEQQDAAMMLFREGQLGNQAAALDLRAQQVGLQGDRNQLGQERLDWQKQQADAKAGEADAAGRADAEFFRNAGGFGPTLDAEGNAIDTADAEDTFRQMPKETRRQVINAHATTMRGNDVMKSKADRQSQDEDKRRARISARLTAIIDQEFNTPDLASDVGLQLEKKALGYMLEDPKLGYAEATRLAESVHKLEGVGGMGHEPTDQEVTEEITRDPYRYIQNGVPNRAAAAAQLKALKAGYAAKSQRVAPPRPGNPANSPQVLPAKYELDDAAKALAAVEGQVNALKKSKAMPAEIAKLGQPLALARQRLAAARMGYMQALTQQQGGMGPVGPDMDNDVDPAGVPDVDAPMGTQQPAGPVAPPAPAAAAPPAPRTAPPGAGPGAAGDATPSKHTDEQIAAALSAPGRISEDAAGNFVVKRADGSAVTLTAQQIQQAAAQYPNLSPMQRIAKLLGE